MGYVDLVSKIIEICVLLVVIVSRIIMWVLPWRKSLLEKMYEDI